MNDQLKRLTESFPSSFLLSLEEHVQAAFVGAERFTQSFDEPERINMRGQARHALSESGFRAAADASEIRCVTSPTKPRGGYYSCCESGGVYLLRANIQTHCGTPRPSRFRRALASLNAFLLPEQFDLFQETEAVHNDRLCCMLVTVAHKQRYQQHDRPAWIGLGIPMPDLSNWYLLKSISEIVAAYHPVDGSPNSVQDPIVVIRDMAIPKIKQ